MNIIESRTLTHARGLLQACGWIQGRSRTTDGYCLTGACKRASGGGNTVKYRDATSALFTCLPDECRERWAPKPSDHPIRMRTRQVSALIEWNDTPYRTKEEVLDLFNRALEATA